VLAAIRVVHQFAMPDIIDVSDSDADNPEEQEENSMDEVEEAEYQLTCLEEEQRTLQARLALEQRLQEELHGKRAKIKKDIDDYKAQVAKLTGIIDETSQKLAKVDSELARSLSATPAIIGNLESVQKQIADQQNYVVQAEEEYHNRVAKRCRA